MPSTGSIIDLCRNRLVALLIPGLLVIAAASAAGEVAGAGAESLELERHRGKVVVVDFWASWCKPCRQSIPWLNEMHSRYGNQGLVIVGVNVDASRADAERFLETTPIDFEIVFDPDGALARRYALKGMPSTFVFDRDGQLVATHLGFRQAARNAREADLKQLIDKAAGS
ncbi:MAG TPA: TlpA disulfide reductase family protein [Steroidobacteraceae bacterium]